MGMLGESYLEPKEWIKRQVESLDRNIGNLREDMQKKENEVIELGKELAEYEKKRVMYEKALGKLNG